MSKYALDLDYTIPSIDISREELNEIIAEADTIIQENSETPEKLAMAYLKKAQCLQKLEEYKEVGKNKSERGSLDFSLDDDELNDLLGYSQEPIKNLLEKTLEIIPDMPEAFMQMGKYYIEISKSGRYLDKAIEMYSQAIKLKPDYAAAFNNRGVLYASEIYSRVKNNNPQDNYNKAIDDFTEAIKIRLFDAMYYFNRGRIYSRLKEHKHAIDDFSNAINYGSDEFKKKIPLFYLRGEEYTEIQDYENAINDFTESIRIRPDLIRALLMRGNAYLAIGNKDKAKTDFDEYLQRKRENEQEHLT